MKIPILFLLFALIGSSIQFDDDLEINNQFIETNENAVEKTFLESSAIQDNTESDNIPMNEDLDLESEDQNYPMFTNCGDKIKAHPSNERKFVKCVDGWEYSIECPLDSSYDPVSYSCHHKTTRKPYKTTKKPYKTTTTKKPKTTTTTKKPYKTTTTKKPKTTTTTKKPKTTTTTKKPKTTTTTKKPKTTTTTKKPKTTTTRKPKTTTTTRKPKTTTTTKKPYKTTTTTKKPHKTTKKPCSSESHSSESHSSESKSRESYSNESNNNSIGDVNKNSDFFFAEELVL